MTEGELPPQRLRSGPRALAYASALPMLQHIARGHGYALAVHGSMQTDLDLIACPWTDSASSAAELVEALREAVDGHFLPINNDPRMRPHGRACWAIHMKDSPLYLDVSVMPRIVDKASVVV